MGAAFLHLRCVPAWGIIVTQSVSYSVNHLLGFLIDGLS
jgi:hypothetical protein